jgi:hypothetical protein
MLFKSVDPATVTVARSIQGDNARQRGAVSGSPSNPTDNPRKIFKGAVKDRLELGGNKPKMQAESTVVKNYKISVVEGNQNKSVWRDPKPQENTGKTSNNNSNNQNLNSGVGGSINVSV